MNPIQQVVTWDQESLKAQMLQDRSSEKFSEMVRRIECKKKLNYAHVAMKESLEPGKEIKINEKKILIAVNAPLRKKHSNDSNDEMNRKLLETMSLTSNIFDLMIEATSLKISHFRDKEDLLISLLDVLDNLQSKYKGVDLASPQGVYLDMYSQSLEKFKHKFIFPLFIENKCYNKDNAAFTMRRKKIEQASDYFNTFTIKHRKLLTTEKDKLGYSLLEGIFPLKNLTNSVAIECLIISPNTLLGVYALHKDILSLAQLFTFGAIIMERPEVDSLQKMSILHFFLKLCDLNIYPGDKLLEEVESAFHELKTQCENLNNEEISRVFKEIDFYFNIRYKPVPSQEQPSISNEEYNEPDINIFLDLIALQGTHFKNFKAFVRSTTNEITYHSAMLIRRLTFTSFLPSEETPAEFLAATEFSNKLFMYIKSKYFHYADPKNHDASNPKNEIFPDPSILLSNFEMQHASNSEIDPFYLMTVSHLSSMDLNSPHRMGKEIDQTHKLSSPAISPRSGPDTSPSLSPRKESDVSHSQIFKKEPEKMCSEGIPAVCLSVPGEVASSSIYSRKETESLPSLSPRKETDSALSSHRKSDTAPSISPRRKVDSNPTLSPHRKSDGPSSLIPRKEADQSLSLPPKKESEHSHAISNRPPRLSTHSFKIEGGPFASSSTSPRKNSKGSDSHTIRRNSKSPSPRSDVELSPMTKEDEIRNNIVSLFISMAHRLAKNNDFFSAFYIHSAIKNSMDKQIEKIKAHEMSRKSKYNEKETEYGKILRKLKDLNHLIDSSENYKQKIKECQRNNSFYNPEIAKKRTEIFHALEKIPKSDKSALSKTIPIDFEYIFNLSPLILKESAILENFRFISRQNLKKPAFSSGIITQINKQELD